jgi:D-aminoacyl-tRNA deacylase
MGDAGSNDGKPQRHIHRIVHIEQFERDMTLIMVHRHHAIELAIDGAPHQRIDGQGALHIDTSTLRSDDCRFDEPLFLVAKQPSLAAMRVECGDSNPRFAIDPLCGQELSEDSITKLDRVSDRVFGQRRKHIAQRHVQRRMHDTQSHLTDHASPRWQVKHHRHLIHATLRRQQFRMARVVDAGRMEGFLADRRRHDRRHAMVPRQIDRGIQRVVGRLPTGGTNFAGGNAVGIRVPDLDHRHRLSVADRILQRSITNHLHCVTTQTHRAAHHIHSAKHHWPGPRMQRITRPSVRNDLGADPRGIAHRDRQVGEGGGHKNRSNDDGPKEETTIDGTLDCESWSPIMRAVLQRVHSASVEVDGTTVGQIPRGLLIFLGVAVNDSIDDVKLLADRALGLRIFSDEQGKMNLNLMQVGGAVLVVSQFTLLADCSRGRRPSFTAAAPPTVAKELYEAFIQTITGLGVSHVATGIFAADMNVQLVNDGPVTIVLDTASPHRPNDSTN